MKSLKVEALGIRGRKTGKDVPNGKERMVAHHLSILVSWWRVIKINERNSKEGSLAGALLSRQ